MLKILRIIFGFPLIAIGLHFTEVVPNTKHAFAEYADLGDWELELLPDWSVFGWYFMRPYQNLWDGVRGDKRGWYTKNYGQGYWAKLWWTAGRNPTNYQSRVTESVDIAQYATWVATGYRERVDEDEGIFGESMIIGMHKATGNQIYAYSKMVKLPFGYYALWREGYKFSLGDEKQDFGNQYLIKTYDGIRNLTIMYAEAGYKQGEAVKALERLAPSTSRGFIPTIKKIKS